MEESEPTKEHMLEVFELMRRDNYDMKRDMLHFKRVIKSLHVFNNDLEKKVNAIDNRHLHNNVIVVQNEIILMRVVMAILRRRIEELREELAKTVA